MAEKKFLRRLTALVLSLTALVLCAPARAQDRNLRLITTNPERRVALVIGNSAYSNAPLTNPVNDARAMRQTLSSFGFEVLYGENQTQNQMKSLIRQLGEKLRGGGVGLFYFAGHGVQVKGQNYLIPIGAVVSTEAETEDEGVEVSRVVAQMEEAGNGLNFVILDACRDNPFPRSYRSSARGLAPVDARGGMLIAYATAPNSTASDGAEGNGLYTQELLRAMREPGLLIEEVFKRVRIAVSTRSGGRQIPWESTSLTGDFSFVGGRRAADSADAKPPATPAGSTPGVTVNGPPYSAPAGKLDKTNAQPAAPTRAKKNAGRVLLSVAVTGGAGGSATAPASVVQALTGEFVTPLSARLEGQGLTVTTPAQLSVRDAELYSGAVNARHRDGQALRALPYAVVLEMTITSLQDSGPDNGIFVAKVNGKIAVIDTEDGRTVAVEPINQARGFGQTLEQARLNVMRAVAERISESFISSVADRAR